HHRLAPSTPLRPLNFRRGHPMHNRPDDEVYDWVIVFRAVTGQHHLIPRPLCQREIREAADILHQRGHATTNAIAGQLHIAVRDLKRAIRALDRQTAGSPA
ncbi:MAG: hypothetical protein ACRDT2_17660, partial [Natronosporangium sp.]